MKRVLVVGGRDYSNREFLTLVLDKVREYFGDFVLVHGEEGGAGALAYQWADNWSMPRVSYPALWHVYGNAAGPLRNEQVFAEERIDLLVAFKGDEQTVHAMKEAKKAGVQVWDVWQEKI